jgi:hypothetical protein
MKEVFSMHGFFILISIYLVLVLLSLRENKVSNGETQEEKTKLWGLFKEIGGSRLILFGLPISFFLLIFMSA